MAKLILRKAFLASMLGGVCALTEPALAAQPGSADSLRARLEQFSEPQLKAAYLRCGREAEVRRLDGCEIAVCSVGREVLLTKAFAGNFDALLNWSKTQKRSEVERLDGGIPLCDD